MLRYWSCGSRMAEILSKKVYTDPKGIIPTTSWHCRQVTNSARQIMPMILGWDRFGGLLSSPRQTKDITRTRDINSACGITDFLRGGQPPPREESSALSSRTAVYIYQGIRWSDRSSPIEVSMRLPTMTWKLGQDVSYRACLRKMTFLPEIG